MVSPDTAADHRGLAFTRLTHPSAMKCGFPSTFALIMVTDIRRANVFLTIPIFTFWFILFKGHLCKREPSIVQIIHDAPGCQFPPFCTNPVPVAQPGLLR